MELIAHRAGNRPPSIAPAAEVADVIEVDVHLFRGRLEVRHEKVVWPFAVYWEKWELRPDVSPPPLSAILDALPDGAHLWIDLKGFSSRLARRVLSEVGGRRPLTASTRSWWTLRPMRAAPDIRTFRSIGSTWQLWLALRFGTGRSGDGIVMHERFARPDTIARLSRFTSGLVVWAVTDEDRAVELAGMGATGVIVDDLGLIERIRRRLDG